MALPSTGFICKSCGAMMSSEQIKQQKEYIKQQDNNKVFLKSDIYNKEPIEYKNKKENKILGALLIILIVILLIILAIFKVM